MIERRLETSAPCIEDALERLRGPDLLRYLHVSAPTDGARQLRDPVEQPAHRRRPLPEIPILLIRSGMNAFGVVRPGFHHPDDLLHGAGKGDEPAIRPGRVSVNRQNTQILGPPAQCSGQVDDVRERHRVRSGPLPIDDRFVLPGHRRIQRMDHALEFGVPTEVRATGVVFAHGARKVRNRHLPPPSRYRQVGDSREVRQ